MTSAKEHHLTVTRSARYHTHGEPSAAVREVWFALHGHAQLSAYFIRHFAGLASPTRLIVAPEGLNRFYMEATSWRGASQARVGATWMTREDRLSEIADYVAYLDALHALVFATVPREKAKLVVLGFSQGVATACRWLAQAKARADTLIMWAGPLPTELDAESVNPLRATRIIRVLGDADKTADAGTRETEEARMTALGLTSEMVRFPGGHQLDAGVLEKLAV